MTAQSAGANRRKTERATPRPENVGQRAIKVLAVVDGSERAGRVVEYLIDLAERDETIDVILLNVQPKPEDWRLRGYGSFKQGEIVDRLVRDLGRPIVANVARKLEHAGIAHKDRVELGDPAATILRCAEEENCSAILIGEGPSGPIRRWLSRTMGVSVGLVSAQLVELGEIPVVVVK